VKNSPISTKKSSQKNFPSQNQKEYAVKNSPISAKKSSKRIFFFFLGGLKILPTISTRFLVLVIFKKTK
jgi:hypothetical protein